VDGREEVALISLRCGDWETMSRESAVLNKYGWGEIEALVSGFTEFAIWELKQVLWRHFKTQRWRDDLMKINFGGRHSNGQVVLFLQTQERDVLVQKDVFTVY